MRRMLLALVALGALAAPSSALAKPVKRWQKTYRTNCVAIAPASDPFGDGCQVQTAEDLEFQIGQLVGGGAVTGASPLTITVAPSQPQCATVQVQTSGSYKRAGISDHLEDPVDFDLSQGHATSLDQSDWFSGAWDLHVLLTVNTPSMACPSAPPVSEGDRFTVTLSSLPNIGQIGGVQTTSRAGHGIDVFFGWSGAGRITISATARTAGVKPFVFARKSFVARQPSDGSRFHLSPDARARSLLARGKLLRVVVTVTEHPQRGRVNSQTGYGSLIP